MVLRISVIPSPIEDNCCFEFLNGPAAPRGSWLFFVFWLFNQSVNRQMDYSLSLKMLTDLAGSFNISSKLNCCSVIMLVALE